MHRFILHLESFGLRYHEIRGDGNSLYRCLAIILEHGEKAFEQVR